MSIAKQLLFFMTPEDERVFSDGLKSKFPSMIFLDGNVWPTPEPVISPSIGLIQNNYGHVYLWNRNLFPKIPIGPRAAGGFQGPGSGPVLQFLRCIAANNVIRSGRIAMGFEDEDVTTEVEQYIRTVWKMIKQVATSKLICVDPSNGKLINPKVMGYWIWPDALRWCRAEKGRFLRDRATQNYYLPAG